MAFPDVTTVIDDFNVGTAPVSASIWASKVGSAAAPDITAISNQLAAASASDNGCTVNSYGPDVDAFLTCAVPIAAASYFAIFVGLTTQTGAFNGYALVISKGTPDTWQLRKYTAGSSGGNLINVTSTTLAAGDKVGIECVGTTMRAWKNAAAGGGWTQIGADVTGQTFVSGKVGVELGDTTQRWDDFSGGTASAPGTVTALPMAGTGDLVAPAVVANATVVAVPMAGTGDVVAPAVSTVGDATVTALPMAGTGDLVAPAVSGSASSFPQNTTLIDDFNDGTAPVKPGVWAGKVGSASVPDITVIANQLGAASAGDNGYTIASFGPDVDFFIDCVVAPAAASYVAFFFALTTPAGAFDGYALVISQGSPNDTWQLRRYTAGANAATVASGTSPTLVGGTDSVGVGMVGTTLTAYKKSGAGAWTSVVSGADSAHTQAGRFGMELGGTTQRWDNLSGGTVASSGDATVFALPLAGSGDLVAPAVAGSGVDATVSAVPLAGTGDLVAPVAGANVAAVPMAGTGDMPDLPLSSEVVASTMAGTGDIVAPAAGLSSITALPMAGSGDVIAPVVAAGVAAIPMAGSGDVVGPSFNVGSAVTSTPLAGTGHLIAPVVSGGGFGVPPTIIHPTTLVLTAHSSNLTLNAHQTSLVLNAHATNLQLNAHQTSLVIDSHSTKLSLDSQ